MENDVSYMEWAFDEDTFFAGGEVAEFFLADELTAHGDVGGYECEGEEKSEGFGGQQDVGAEKVIDEVGKAWIHGGKGSDF